MDGFATFIRSDAPKTVGQIVLDETLAQRIIGVRRGRESSPTATPQPNKALLQGSRVTKLYVPRRLLLGTYSAVGSSSSGSSSGSAAVDPPSPPVAQPAQVLSQPIPDLDYENWTELASGLSGRQSTHDCLPPVSLPLLLG